MLTICMAIYGQPKMLAHQLATMEDYPQSVRDNLNLIIVDDHGDPEVTKWDVMHFDSAVNSAQLFRVDSNIPWNQMGARNLAMEHAKGWCLMIDPDMVFSAGIMTRMLEAQEILQRGQVLKYGLKHKKSGKLDMSSPNTYMIHRDDFFRVGGYDEDFAGNKGWSDVQLLDVLTSCYKLQKRPDLHAEFYGPSDISDAMVTSLDRNTRVNRAKRIRKVSYVRKSGGWARYAQLRAIAPRLRFKWHKVY